MCDFHRKSYFICRFAWCIGLQPFAAIDAVLLCAGGMQDYNYVRGSCYELTMEISCCKYPPVAELPDFWEANRPALINYLLQVHIGRCDMEYSVV